MAIYLQAQAPRESRTLCGAGANQPFEQELQDFNVALAFLQARTPSIKPMLPQKKTMDAGAFPQGFRNAFPQFNHVLRILQDRQPLAVLVGSNAFQSFEHFVSLQGDTALWCVRARKDGPPNRMSVQNRAGTYAARDGEMEQGFRRRAAIAADNVGRVVHLQKLRGRNAALVQAR